MKRRGQVELHPDASDEADQYAACRSSAQQVKGAGGRSLKRKMEGLMRRLIGGEERKKRAHVVVRSK